MSLSSIERHKGTKATLARKIKRDRHLSGTGWFLPTSFRQKPACPLLSARGEGQAPYSRNDVVKKEPVPETPPKRSQSPNARAPFYLPAFALVELLVVIALIMLIVSLVIPALGRARDQANIVACRANLRSLALGCLAYAGENDSVLPIDGTVDNPHTGLIDILGAGKYVDVSESYYCPSETRPDLRYCRENFQAGNISYFYYSFTERPTSRYLSNFLRKTIQWPRILKTTMPGNTWVSSDSWFSNMPTAHRYYKKGVNYVTLSATVEMVRQSPRTDFR